MPAKELYKHARVYEGYSMHLKGCCKQWYISNARVVVETHRLIYVNTPIYIYNYIYIIIYI